MRVAPNPLPIGGKVDTPAFESLAAMPTPTFMDPFLDAAAATAAFAMPVVETSAELDNVQPAATTVEPAVVKTAVGGDAAEPTAPAESMHTMQAQSADSTSLDEDHGVFQLSSAETGEAAEISVSSQAKEADVDEDAKASMAVGLASDTLLPSRPSTPPLAILADVEVAELETATATKDVGAVSAEESHAMRAVEAQVCPPAVTAAPDSMLAASATATTPEAELHESSIEIEEELATPLADHQPTPDSVDEDGAVSALETAVAMSAPSIPDIVLETPVDTQQGACAVEATLEQDVAVAVPVVALEAQSVPATPPVVKIVPPTPTVGAPVEYSDGSEDQANAVASVPTEQARDVHFQLKTSGDVDLEDELFGLGNEDLSGIIGNSDDEYGQRMSISLKRLHLEQALAFSDSDENSSDDEPISFLSHSYAESDSSTRASSPPIEVALHDMVLLSEISQTTAVGSDCENILHGVVLDKVEEEVEDQAARITQQQKGKYVADEVDDEIEEDVSTLVIMTNDDDPEVEEIVEEELDDVEEDVASTSSLVRQETPLGTNPERPSAELDPFTLASNAPGHRASTPTPWPAAPAMPLRNYERYAALTSPSRSMSGPATPLAPGLPFPMADIDAIVASIPSSPKPMDLTLSPLADSKRVLFRGPNPMHPSLRNDRDAVARRLQTQTSQQHQQQQQSQQQQPSFHRTPPMPPAHLIPHHLQMVRPLAGSSFMDEKLAGREQTYRQQHTPNRGGNGDGNRQHGSGKRQHKGRQQQQQQQQQQQPGGRGEGQQKNKSRRRGTRRRAGGNGENGAAAHGGGAQAVPVNRA
ncbi:hypothetical protein THASP1DRAFT_33569 [Thamnocephalis sphaerospora]|uniref:Uncharacterized protein n=1 Tax=Thamnocephalis sphaerospora TaxID=78915 RepID=A0A4P9XHG0_9FUNG|nr:hypothetical protein THASP1DRAFT_33569 [Thamnocephalis sphaerospora]|eukprot:RKP04640.1 hypothetical protein THASP1DRAFT_33569 [Thamnocephalis sphaerospora]